MNKEITKNGVGMELMEKQGYKQTEVGVIPEDWEVKGLGDLGQFLKGKGIKKDEVTSDGIPCVRYGELYTVYSNKIERTVSFINESTSKESVQLRYGDLLFAGSGETKEEIGKSAVILRNDTYAGGDIVIFRTKDLDFQFLGYLSNFSPIQKQKSLNGQGDAVVHIYAGGLSKVKIPLPPILTEQRAISTALSDVDALISCLERLIAKKKAIKQGAMQELLTPPHKGGKRLAGFSGEWEEKRLGEISDISGAGVDKKVIEGELPVRLLNYMDVMKRDYIYNMELNHEVTAPYAKTINCNVIEGDIFLTPSSELRTDIGLSAIAVEDMEAVVYSYHVYRLRYKIDIDKMFGLYVLKTKYFLDQPEKLCEGSGKRYVVSMSKFRDMTIYLPSDLEEQKAIAQILYDMDEEIEALEAKKEKFKGIKQGMMQELLTGKIRLV